MRLGSGERGGACIPGTDPPGETTLDSWLDDPFPVFDFRAHFCHSAPMEAHAFSFRLRAQRPGVPKAISYQSTAKMAKTVRSPAREALAVVTERSSRSGGTVSIQDDA